MNAFLERHAFPGVNSLRDTSDVFQHVRVKQLYPLDVAEELGDERMMSLLKMSGQHPKPILKKHQDLKTTR